MAVTYIDIQSRAPYQGGMTFGDTGAYEQLDGTVHFAVDPSDPANNLISDLALAPKNGDGLVEFSADFRILKPVDPSKGSHKLFFDVVNRGNVLSLGRINSGSEGMDPGNGFLMRRGYTQVWCGWQHDVPQKPGLLKVNVPNASDANGPVTGRIAVTFQPNALKTTQMLSDRDHQPYSVKDLDQPYATLTVKDHDTRPVTVIPRSEWSFGRLEEGTFTADSNHICMASGFEAGKVYQCIYTTAVAPVVGLGFAAVRDLVSHLRYSTAPDNPCAGDIQHSLAFGSSQSGRFLRQMLYLAMNQDEEDRTVFDGIIANIAGGRRGEFNQRFGQPSSTIEASTASLFPFADTEQTDPETGQTDALLARLQVRGKLPKLLLTNSSSEYWGGHASLTHTDTDGERDITHSDNVRIYHFAGTQHQAGTLPLGHVQATGNTGLNPFNWVDWRPLLRAAVHNLDNWVTSGVLPPDSKHPRLDDGTAVDPESLRPVFDDNPKIEFPAYMRHLSRLDFGPDDSVIEKLPPVTGKDYPVFVSKVDQDGNEVAGIRLPAVAVPLATVMGWNLRHPDTGGPGQTHRIMGSTIPFAFTQQEREDSGDPRPSVEERYPSRQAYLQQVEECAKELASQGYMLDEDIHTVTLQAGERYDLLESKVRQVQPPGD